MERSVEQILRKYLIMGSQNCDGDPLAILEAAAKAGITAFQFREKGAGSLTGNAKLQLGKQLRNICRVYDIPFIVNDDIELVDPLEADGIHVGQEDQSVAELSRRYPEKIIGLSVSNWNEVTNSPISLVDYIGAGPIFATDTKTDAKSAVGLDWIKALREHFPELPIVGIGGINPGNSASVIQAGANGVSFISAVTKASDIDGAVQAL